MILRALVILSLPALAAYAQADPPTLEEQLEIIFKQSELLPVLAGVKPISTIELPIYATAEPASQDAAFQFTQLDLTDPIDRQRFSASNEKYAAHVRAFYARLAEAQQNGPLRNPEVEFIYFLEHNGLKPNVAVVNRSALQRLLEDPAAMKVLAEYGDRTPKTVDEALKMFRQAADSGGFYRGPASAQAMVGILLGYPPADVRLYAQEVSSNAKNSFPRLAHPSGKSGFGPRDSEAYLGSFANLTRENSADKALLHESGSRALAHFKRLRGQGQSYVQIFNRGPEMRTELNSIFRSQCVRSRLGSP
ncbi:MAG: DUF3793 family protein [Bacteriovoracia bacterium]